MKRDSDEPATSIRPSRFRAGWPSAWMMNKIAVGVLMGALVAGAVLLIVPLFGVGIENGALSFLVWLAAGTVGVGAAIVLQSLTIEAELRRGYTTLTYSVENVDLRHRRDGSVLRSAGAHYRESRGEVTWNRAFAGTERVTENDGKSQSRAVVVGLSGSVLALIVGVLLAVTQWTQHGAARANVLIASTAITALITTALIAIFVLGIWLAQRNRVNALAQRLPNARVFHSVRNMDLVCAIWGSAAVPPGRWPFRPISSAFAVSIGEDGIGLWVRAGGPPKVFIPRQEIRSLRVMDVPNEKAPGGGPALVVGTTGDTYFPLRLWASQRGFGRGLTAQQLAEIRQDASIGLRLGDGK